MALKWKKNFERLKERLIMQEISNVVLPLSSSVMHSHGLLCPWELSNISRILE